MRRSIVVLFLAFILVACVGKENESENADKPEMETKEEQEVNTEEVVEETEDGENNEEINDEDANAETADFENEDHDIDGKVIVNKDENVVRVELETNLVEGTTVDVNLLRAYGQLSSGIGTVGSEKGEIQTDGTAFVDYPLDNDFFEKFHGEHVEVRIELKSDQYDDHLSGAYGKHGENFKGPFVYQYNLLDSEAQRLYAPVYIKVGDEKTEYAIETPDRNPLPDDYGETEVWVETEFADNDHQLIYVKGKSNLIEGMMLQAKYFSDEKATFAQEGSMETFVEPDGTFMLPVKYDSITNDGYIEIQGAPQRSHRTKDQIYEAYGKDFEELTGDVVEEVKDHQEVLLTIEKEGIDMEAPEDSLVTEEDGELKIQVPDDVLFDFDKSDLKDNAKGTLNEVIDILEELDDGRDILVNGHTDNEGDPDYNLDLSEDRAASVEQYLTKSGDINDLNIKKKGYGETKPAASNEEEEGRQRNRRVEIVFQKNV